MNPKPRVSFLMPHRWLTEDRAFLTENIKRQFIKDWGSEHLYELEGIPAYRIIIICRFKQPIKETVKKAEVQKALKSFFPIGKCLGVEQDFIPHKSKTMLPVLEFQAYF